MKKHLKNITEISRIKLPMPESPGECAFALHCRAEKLNPLREYMFHPKRKWRVDFYFPEHKIAVEIEGRGRHQTYSGFEDDCYKYNAAAKMGIIVLRYTTAMTIQGDAINDILEMIR